MFVFKSLNGLAPTYLDVLVKRHTSTRSLRSSDQHLLTIPRARLKLKGDRAFSVAAPKLWNLLPVSIRSAQTISSFKLLLKTYLLTQAFNLSECWVLCSLCLFLCGAMSLSLYIYENGFCLLFFGFLVFYFCTALWATMVVLFCAIEIKWNEKKKKMKLNEITTISTIYLLLVKKYYITCCCPTVVMNIQMNSTNANVNLFL